MLRRRKPSALVQRLLLNCCKGEMISSQRAAVSIERKFSTRILGRLLGQRQSGDWTWLAVHKYLADTPGATIGSATSRQAPSKIPLKGSGRALTILQAYYTCDRDTGFRDAWQTPSWPPSRPSSKLRPTSLRRMSGPRRAANGMRGQMKDYFASPKL